MFELLGVLIALLAIEEDEDERLRIVLGILAMFIHIQQYNMLRNHSNRLCALISASVFLLRNDPSGAYSWQGSTIYRTIHPARINGRDQQSIEPLWHIRGVLRLDLSKQFLVSSRGPLCCKA